MTEMFFRAPVDPEVVRDHFAFADDAESAPLPPEEAEKLTAIINDEALQHTVWGNPEKDSRNFRLNGCPVELGSRSIKLVGGEFAVFPPASA